MRRHHSRTLHLSTECSPYRIEGGHADVSLLLDAKHEQPKHKTRHRCQGELKQVYMYLLMARVTLVPPKGCQGQYYM